MSKQEVMPAGSQSPNANKEETVPPAGETPKSGNDDKDVAGKLLGKFESPEDLAKSYAELETTLGRQKSEIGDLRKKLQEVEQNISASPNEPAEPPTDFEVLRQEVQQKVEDGELSIGEGLAKMSEITKQETAADMEQKFAEYDKKRTAEEVYSDFVDSHPDFLEMEQQGIIDQEMATNPMHDKFSAYWAAKAKVEAEAAYKRGQEEALKLARGADGTRQVLKGSGGTAREVPTARKGMPESERTAGMMAALQAARGA